MGKKTMTREEMMKVLEDLGMKIAPADHPAYSEGVTISFISRKPQTQKRTLKNLWPLYAPHNDSDYEDDLEEGKDSEENTPGRNIVSDEHDKLVADINEGLAIITENGRHVVVDEAGKEVFNLTYDSFFPHFSEGMLAVQQGGKWGFVDKTGKLAIEPVYDNVKNFKEGVATVVRNGEEIYINKEGKEIIFPKKSHDKLVKIECDEKYGFVDKEGREVVAPKYDYIGDFNLGLAEFYIEDDDGYAQYGVINEYGEEIVPAMYESIEILNNGFIVVTGEYELLGLYNKEGKKLFEPYYNNYEYIGDFKEGFAIVHERNGTFKEDGPPGYNFENIDYVFINEDGKAISSYYECASNFNEGMAAVKKNGLWGFIDKDGNEVVELAYDEVRAFHGGRAAVCLDGKWGYIDSDDKV